MLKFSTLLIRTEQQTDQSNKIDLLTRHFSSINHSDIILTIRLLVKGIRLKTISADLLREFAKEFSALPDWLIDESINTAGETIEGLSLILPQNPKAEEDLSLSEVVRQLQIISTSQMSEQKILIFELWRKLHPDSRLTVNKLLTSRFRSPFSVSEIAKALSGLTTFSPLYHFSQLSGYSGAVEYENVFMPPQDSPQWKLYDFKMADESEIGNLRNDEAVFFQQIPEGIRAQLIIRNDFTIFWTLEDKEQKKVAPFNLEECLFRGVLDGYLTKPNQDSFIVTDILEADAKDVSNLMVSEKNKLLTEISAAFSGLPIFFNRWDEIKVSHDLSKMIGKNSEGLVVEYETENSGRWVIRQNRKKIKTVLLYAQKEDQHTYLLTMGLFDGGQWVPVTKVNGGLTNAEWRELDVYIEKNTIEKFGPVRTVKPELVFEISYERVSLSKRHKSGLILHSPVLEKWLKFGLIEEILPLQSFKKQSE